MTNEMSNSTKVNESYGGQLNKLMGTVLGSYARNKDDGLRLWQANFRF